MSSYSIVEYFGESTEGKCGYCKQSGRYNSHGFWAHSMNVFDYQALIQRNWRRSGQYCYRPKNIDTCCPMYTIKNDALNFKLTRSHKKILKKMNKFLRDGSKDKNYGQIHEAGTREAHEQKPAKEHSDVRIDDINVSSLQRGNYSKVNVSLPARNKNDGQVQEKNHSVSSDGNRPPNAKKAKIIRLERKKEKLAAKGLTLNDVMPRKAKNGKSVSKTLEEFLAMEPKDGKHQLEVK